MEAGGGVSEDCSRCAKSEGVLQRAVRAAEAPMNLRRFIWKGILSGVARSRGYEVSRCGRRQVPLQKDGSDVAKTLLSVPAAMTQSIQQEAQRFTPTRPRRVAPRP